jgi:hypothetical protein
MKRIVTFLISLSMLTFAACTTSYFLTSQPVAAQNIVKKRLLIVTYDTEATQTMLISFKNYLNRALNQQQVETQNINIRHNEAAADLADLGKKMADFKPEYLLNVRVGAERTHDLYLLTAKKKFKFRREKAESILRDAAFDLTLLPNTEGGKEIWNAQAAVKKVYQSEQIRDVRKMVARLTEAMRKDGLLQ